MCGIAGKLSFIGTPVDTADIRKMTDRLAHRGPDDEGVFVDGPIGLGHRRLSIIDLSPKGHQPMSDPTGDVWIVFNGEIYNYRSLRTQLESDGVRFVSETDTEVIIHLYKRHGVQCLGHLRGMFAFGIWDARLRRLFVARDRVGKKPLKYYVDAQRFVFASELKALFADPHVPKHIDHEAVDEYLTFGYVPHPRTGFLGIQKLEPAHYLLVEASGKVQKERYWQLDFSTKQSRSHEEWKQMIERELREAVRLRLISDVPLGAHLSGGLDSSLVVAMMAKETSRPVKTFSIGFVEDSHNELPFAREVARLYQTDHHEFVVEPKAADILPRIAEHLEEPFADPSILPTWYLSQLTREHVTVALNGDGGDENFAGYARYQAMRHYERLRRLHPLVCALRRPLSRTMKDRRHVASLLNAYDWSRAKTYLGLRRMVEGHTGLASVEALFSQAQHQDWRDRLLSVDIASYLPDDLLVKADMASMAHALEMRSPFLDHPLMELVAAMPPELKLHGRSSKVMLKHIARAYLPDSIIDRTKKGFTIPHSHWLRTSLNPLLKEVLSDDALAPWGFDRVALARLVYEHEHGCDHGLPLWTLMMLRLWMRAWF